MTAALLLIGPTPGLGADDSLARSVPADVGLFAEIRGADDLLNALTEPQIWTTLAELVGQPAQPEDVARWRQRIQQAVKMTPDEAIRVLFARGVAFVGEGPGRSQDAVVVCRPAAEHPVAKLLERWSARKQPQPQRPPTYSLYRNIGVAEHGDLLLFGDLLPREGLFRRLQRHVAEAQSKPLAADPVFQKLLARVPPNPDGVFFARLAQAASLLIPGAPASSQPATQPRPRRDMPRLPGPLRGAENVLFALHREASLLHFTAVGDPSITPSRPPAGPLRLIEHLPQRTLCAWEGHFDYAQVPKALAGLPERSPLHEVFQLQEQMETLNRFFGALDTDTCVAVGPVHPNAPAADAPPLPALALLISTRDAAAANRELKTLANLGVAAYAVFSVTSGVPPLQGIEETSVNGTPTDLLDLSPLLKPTAREAFGQVHFCWAVHKDTLIGASHLDWLREIIAAREGRTPDLTGALRLSATKLNSGSANAIVVQSGPISDIGNLWLEYLRRTKPEAFNESWWRSRQPGGENVRLGINVTPDIPNRRLRVDQVFQKQPADGWLRIGDFIVGYDNHRFETDDLDAEIRAAIKNRPHARWLDLLIVRGGITRPLRLPLPFLNPLEALQRLTAIGKLAQRAVYHDDLHAPAGARGFLTIELRTSEKPLFEFTPSTASATTRPSAE